MTLHLSPESDPGARLAQFGLTAEELLAAVRAGVAARRTSTLNHPRAHAGWLDYSERVAALREIKAPHAWTRSELNGVCLVVHPERLLAIMTALGTAGTGDAKATVTTQRPRGPLTERVVRNNAQLELDLKLEETDRPAAGGTPTWVLLVHNNGDEVRSELSLPRHIGEDGFINSWLERIPLPTVRVNDVIDAGEEDASDAGGDVDFDVPEL